MLCTLPRGVVQAFAAFHLESGFWQAHCCNLMQQQRVLSATDAAARSVLAVAADTQASMK